MAEQRQNTARPMGPGRGPGRHGYQKPKDLRGTLGKLMRYLGRYTHLLILVAVLLVRGFLRMADGSILPICFFIGRHP